MKLMLCVRGDGCPLAAMTAPANAAENRLALPLLAGRPTDHLPAIILADRGYDDDGLRDQLAAHGFFLIAPHRKGRKRPERHDGRNLRRYRRRYVVERTNAWWQCFRRLIVRYERYAFLYGGFVALMCLILVARTL